MNTQDFPPKEWDVIMFYVDPTGAQMIESFVVSPVGGTVNGNAVTQLETTSDRVQCQVGLVSTRNGITQVDDPFTSHFMDPFIYAERMLKAGFTGLMVKTGHEFLDNFFKISHALIAQSILLSGQQSVGDLSKEYTKKK